MCVHAFGGMRSPALPSNHGSLPLQNMVLPSQPSGRKLIQRLENGTPAPSVCSSTAPKNAVVKRLSTRGLIQKDTVYSKFEIKPSGNNTPEAPLRLTA